MLPDADTVISIRGVFDSPAAARVRAAYMDAARKNAATRFVVDLSRATEITAIALAILVEQQAMAHGPPLTVRGLSKRHDRMLRYLSSFGAAVAAG